MQMNQHSHLKKLFSIWINLSSVNQKLKELWHVPLEIDGEENSQHFSFVMRLHLKIYLFKAQQGQESPKSREDWPNQQMLLSCESKRQNTPKSGTLAKTQARSSKISISSKLNLAKVGFNNFKVKIDRILKQMKEKVQHQAYLQILDAMIGPQTQSVLPTELRQKKLEDLKKGHYNDQTITLLPGVFKPDLDLQQPFAPQKPIKKTVKQIYNFLFSTNYERISRHYNSIDLNKETLKSIEEEGIIFLDEIDKLAVPQGPLTSTGKGVSTEGVQRDLLPLIEGTVIGTKFGDIKTDHILFIASGSFSMAKVQDLIPQLLGRLPIRVVMSPITRDELQRILLEPEYNLLVQQTKLMQSENIKLQFTLEAVKQMASQAYEMNLHTQNIGARRLHQIVEKVMQEISFNAPNHKGEEIIIDHEYVKKRLISVIKTTNLTKFLI